MPVDLLTTAFVPPLEIRTKKCLTNKAQDRRKYTLLTEPDIFGYQHLFYIKNAAGTKFDHLRVPNVTDTSKPVYLLEYATEWDTGDPLNIGWKVSIGQGQPRLPRYPIIPADSGQTGAPTSTIIDIAQTLPNDPIQATQFQNTTTSLGAPYYWRKDVKRPDTDYVLLPKAVQKFTGQQIGISSDANVTCILRGPYPYPGKDDLPAGRCWWNDYIWGNGLKLESCCYVEGAGWSEWWPYKRAVITDPWIADPDFAPSILTFWLDAPCPVPITGYAY